MSEFLILSSSLMGFVMIIVCAIKLEQNQKIIDKKSDLILENQKSITTNQETILRQLHKRSC